MIIIAGKYRHLYKYGWRCSFTGTIYCDRCHKIFKMGQIIYRHNKRLKDMIFNYNYCLPCAKELGFKIDELELK